MVEAVVVAVVVVTAVGGSVVGEVEREGEEDSQGGEGESRRMRRCQDLMREMFLFGRASWV